MAPKEYNVAVAGATGAVGQEMISCLEERRFPVKSIKLLASSRSVGRRLKFNDQEVEVAELTETAFAGVDIALFSAGGGTSERFAPYAAEYGFAQACRVVLNLNEFAFVD